MIVLGIDPGTAVTGFGVIERTGSSMRAIDYGAIRTPRTMDLADRYYALFEAINHLIVKYRPNCVATETQYVDKNVQSALKVGMARGVVIISAKSHGLPYFEYAPSRAKSAVVGKGSATKEQVQTMVQRLLSLQSPPTPLDASDALAIAIAHLHMSQSILAGARS